MGKPTPLTRRESVSLLRKKLAQSNDAEQKTRIRAIINIKEGVLRKDVVRLFCITYTTLCGWVRAYNKGGVPALKFSKGGRPNGNPKWDTKVFDALIKEIDKQERYWSIPLMQEWIKENHKEDIPENTVWYHVRDLNYSYKSSRPHPAKGDKKKQNVFKKKA
jgi:transposase